MNILNKIRGGAKLKKELIIQAVVAAFLFAISLLVMMNSPINPWGDGKQSQDASVFAYGGLAISKGMIPYRDFFDNKGPLMYILNYLGILISYKRGMWLVELAAIFLMSVFVYKTARLHVGKLASCLLTLVAFSLFKDFFLGGNRCEEFAMVALSVAVFIFMDYFVNRNISALRLIICGACFGATFMLKVNMVSAWVVFCMAVLLEYLHDNHKFPLKFLLLFLAGAMLVMLPIIIWLASEGAMKDYIFDNFTYNFSYSSGGAYYKYYMTVVWFNTKMFAVSVLLTVALLFMKKDMFINAIYLACMLFVTFMMGASGQGFSHYGLNLIPLVVYPIAAFVHYLREEMKKPEPILAIVAVISVISAMPFWQDSANTLATGVLLRHGAAELDDDYKGLIAAVTENTTEDEPIQVIGFLDYVYVNAKRVSASKYSYQAPVFSFDDAAKPVFDADLLEKRPKVVVVQTTPGFCYRDNLINIDQYELIYEIPDKYEAYLLKQ